MQLEAGKSILENPNRQQVFILDIDSTLVTTYQRNQAILETFVNERAADFPEDCENLKIAQCQLGDYGYYTSLMRINFEPKDPSSLKALDQFWHEKFFSNEYLSSDKPTPGAVEWVQSLRDKNIGFIYLTARHSQSMWSGTLKSLEEMGFPINENILFLKKDLSDSDETYKSKILKSFLKKWRDHEAWLIDNEPVVLNKVAENHPEVKLLWFNSTHSGKMQPPPNALEVNSFLTD